MKRTKSEKAITLVALIITIIVLLILAVVAIRAVTGDGIIAHAKNARDNYNQAQIEENTMLSNLTDYITGQAGGSAGGSGDTEKLITADKINKILSETSNTELVDKYGNKIKVPAGFKIVVDNGTDASKSTNYTVDTIDVTKGIVIEDGSGNQFVWIPVGGNIKNESKTAPITLGRYSWSESTGTLVQPIAGDDTKSPTSEVSINFTDSGRSVNHVECQPNSTKSNVKARNINDFYNSSIANGGYYLGRYEASESEGTIACKANQVVYSSSTQSEASTKSQDMYVDGYSSGTFSSDLTNSYAWDTAIMFIQTFGTEEDASVYGSKNKSTEFTKTGLNPDKYCNIYDMSGNHDEWTTEACIGDAIYPCTQRGGFYDPRYNSPTASTSYRHYVRRKKWNVRRGYTPSTLL